MIISKEKVCQKIKRGIDKIQFDKESKAKFVETVHDKFNIQTGIVMDYVADRLLLQDATTFILFALSYGLDEVHGSEIVSESFSETEIKSFSDIKAEQRNIEFPLNVNCIMVTQDQWIGSCDVEFLMKLRDAQLINYNVNTQRTMQRIVRGDKELYRIKINRSAVKNIESFLERDIFVPNTLTLNIPETEFDFLYDDEKRELVINSISAFDITDGYHRFLAISRLFDKNPEFNYRFELRITNFSESKTRQFIFQEDQKTKMKKLDSDSMNISADNNILVERLNSNVDFYWCGEISRNEGRINFGELAKVIQFFYFKNKRQTTRQYVFGLEKELVGKLNHIISQNEVLMENKITFSHLMLIFYCINTYQDVDEASRRVGNGIQNIDKLINNTDFKQRRPRKGLLKHIQEII